MKKIIFGIMAITMLSGCTSATWELMYQDARVVYKDAKYVVHEIHEAREEAKK